MRVFYIFDQKDMKSRLEIARQAKACGYDVVLGLIGAAEDLQQDLSGFEVYHIPAQGDGGRVLASVKQLVVMRKILKCARPDIVHVVTLKFSFIAGLAALFMRCRRVYTLAGLGYLFRTESAKAHALRFVMNMFLRAVFSDDRVWLIFQNQDDLDLFCDGGYGQREQSILIESSGVYLDEFEPQFSKSVEGDSIVLMPTRLVREKGVYVFIEAARILKARGVKARFQIAGGENNNPNAISRAEMLALTEDGAVEWLGRVDDLPKRLADAHVVVYPSYYGEGVARVLIEACAAGCAIVTTDHPGCREAVVDGQSGILVPVKNAEATVDAIGRVLSDDNLRRSMGQKSRALAEDKFDIYKIAERTVDVYSA